jgi:Big-like domain-containing protein/PASTA domain-containing protein/lysyl oxidase
MSRARQFLPVAAILLILASLFLNRGMQAAPAGTSHYPDLQAVIPLNSFSVNQPTPTTRELRYTHRVANLGDGPLEVQPQYDPTTDSARAVQRVYSHDASGAWSIVSQLPVFGRFAYHPAHGHYHFPFAKFGLYQIAGDGSVGAPVAISPKVGYCLGDDFVEDRTLTHFGVLGYSGGNCTDPTHSEGISVGMADVYDSNDAGQSIDITALADGTYWFRTIADPDNYITEKDKTNNVTDVKLQISGLSVTVIGSPVHPNSQPPAVTMTAPAAGAVSGTAVVMSANASDPSGITSMQFLIDGSPIGAPVTTPPYSINWDTTATPDGTYYVTAQATAATTFVGTAAPVLVTVSNGAPPPPPPPPPTAFSIDKTLSTDGAGTVSTAAFSVASGELLVALVASDGPGAGGQRVTVSGASATWTLIKRANAQAGTSEIWQAFTNTALSNASVSSAQTFGGYHQSLTVVAVFGSSGTGASVGSSAATGATSIAISTTHDGSLVYAVGNDWDRAVARVLGSNQTMIHQWVDTGVGDTFWVQAQSSPISPVGTVTMNDTSPTTDRWNFAAAEIVPSAPPPVTISNVLATDRTTSSTTIKWTTNVAATSQVDYGFDAMYGTSVVDTALVTTHAIQLNGLSANTTYHYRITSDAGGGNTATAGDFVFTTPEVSQIFCTITAPTGGTVVSGTIPVSAHATSTANVAAIQFQLDGANLGPEVQNPVTDATINWNTTASSNGDHTLTCVARDPTGQRATSSPVAVTVSNIAVPDVVGKTQSDASNAITTAGLTVGATTTASSTSVPPGSVISQNPVANTLVAPNTPVALVISSGPPPLAVDKFVFSDGAGTRTTAPFSTASAGELLVAFVASDATGSSTQTVTVSGAGLQWTLVRRANTQRGDSEIWSATATNQLTNVTVTSTQSNGAPHQSLTVVAFVGASGTGASAVASGASGAPTVSLTTTKAGSLVYGVGNDWDRSIARVLGPNQVMVHQWVDTAIGDTFWVQARSGQIAASGTLVTINDTSPTNDRWNLASVEIVSK